MVEDTVDLDGRRGMAAQNATSMRLDAGHGALGARQEELESLLLVAPAAGWVEAVA